MKDNKKQIQKIQKAIEKLRDKSNKLIKEDANASLLAQAHKFFITKTSNRVELIKTYSKKDGRSCLIADVLEFNSAHTIFSVRLNEDYYPSPDVESFNYLHKEISEDQFKLSKEEIVRSVQSFLTIV